MSYISCTKTNYYKNYPKISFTEDQLRKLSIVLYVVLLQQVVYKYVNFKSAMLLDKTVI